MSERQVSPKEGEGLSRDERLRHRADYLRCYRQGRRQQGSLAVLYYSPNQLRHARIGVTTGRKVGGSVVRHRLRRRTKEIYRRWGDRRKLPALDLVVHWKPEAAEVDFAELERELLGLLGRLVRGQGAR